MNISGFVAVKRSIREWGWYHEPKVFTLFMHLLIDANFKDTEWEGRTIKRGQLVTTITLLSADTGLSRQEVRTCLRRLGGSREVLSTSLGRWSIITVCNYDSYQEQQLGCNSVATRSQPDSNSLNKNKGIKEQRNKDNINTYVADKGAADRLYALYPSSVVRANGSRSSLKSGKDKDKLLRLLTKQSEEELANTIKRYLSENPGAYIKMFSTFLNNLPDYSDDAVLEEQPELPLYDQLRQQANKPQTV